MSDKMREEFEAWALSQWMPLVKSEFDDGYKHDSTQDCWQAWQASRAALVVELPDSWDSNTGIGSYSNDVRSALDAVGVKYE